MLHPATSCKEVHHASALSATASPGNLPRLRGKGWSAVDDAVCSRFRIGHAEAWLARRRAKATQLNASRAITNIIKLYLAWVRIEHIFPAT